MRYLNGFLTVCSTVLWESAHGCSIAYPATLAGICVACDIIYKLAEKSE